jgi:alcohol dehydrogenase class IV
MGAQYRRLSAETGDDLLRRTEYLLGRLEISSPFKGKTPADEQGIVEETLASGSTNANPRPVNADDVRGLLRELFAV